MNGNTSDAIEGAHAAHRAGRQRSERWASRLCLGLLVAVLGCGAPSAQDQLDAARASLVAGAYEEAIASAEAGLAGDPDPIAAWGLEVVRLEALSRTGDGEATVAQLERLAAQSPERVQAAEYSGTAQRLRAAEQKAAAIRVLDIGHKRFPDDAVINKMIADSVETGVDPAELEMLKSLGYID